MTVTDEIALPYRTDWREMSGVLDYCKGKGADRSALEARFGAGESLRETLNALEQLDLVERSDAGDVRLTVLGEQVAYAPDQAKLRARLTEALVGYPPYRFPLERAVADQADLLDAPWVEHIWQVDMRLGQPRNRVEEARTFFFRLADEAGLGTYRRGVRGQTTRLELADGFVAALRPLLERAQAGAGRGAVVAGDGKASRLDSSAQPPATTLTVAPLAPSQESAPSLQQTATVAAMTPSPAGIMPPGSGAAGSFTIHVDMSDWELDKIEGFLRLIGYLPPDRE